MQPLNVIILRSSAGYISLLAMHKTLKFSAAALAISAALSSPVLARPMTAEDLATMKRLAAPALSPDGKLAVYQLRETDMAANKGRTDLYLLRVDDKTAVPVKIASKPDKNEHDPPMVNRFIISATKADRIKSGVSRHRAAIRYKSQSSKTMSAASKYPLMLRRLRSGAM
jgi:hypothetical protein